MRNSISARDFQAIEKAVQEAEKRTSGEIVPYLIESSDPYPEANWKAMALGAMAALLLGPWILRWGSWSCSGIGEFLLAFLGAATGLVGVHSIDFLRRLLIGSKRMETRVWNRAQQEFLRQGIFSTRDRTGILIFLALFERRVVLLADVGIHQKVGQEVWEGVVTQLTKGIREGRALPALEQAIQGCADLLVAHGFTRKPGDTNELQNALQTQGDPR